MNARQAKVLHLYRVLHRCPRPRPLPGVEVRPLRPEDVEAWLALFEQAFQGLEPPVRRWNRDDFRRHLSAKPWWVPEHCLLAWTRQGGASRLLGSVVLAVYSLPETRLGAVHWLMVAPEFRRRGLGRALLAHLEHLAWNQGVRLLRVETHACWKEAVAFYRRLGYVPRCGSGAVSPLPPG